MDKFLDFVALFKKSLYKSEEEKRVENQLLLGLQDIIQKKNSMELQDITDDAYHVLMMQLRRNEQYFMSIFKALMSSDNH